jgi:hypothetical protein
MRRRLSDRRTSPSIQSNTTSFSLHLSIARVISTDPSAADRELYFAELVPSSWMIIPSESARFGVSDSIADPNSLSVCRLLDHQQHSKRCVATERRLKRALEAQQATGDAVADEAPRLKAAAERVGRK